MVENFKWLREKAAQELLGYKRTQMYYLRRNNIVNWSLIGRTIFYDRNSIEKYLENNSSQNISQKSKAV